MSQNVNIFMHFAAAGTKTLVVHGQNECDIPTQLPVHEDTQFEALLKVKTLISVNHTHSEARPRRLITVIKFKSCWASVC